MRWHRLQILMDRLKNDVTEQSYYLATADGTVLQRQVTKLFKNYIKIPNKGSTLLRIWKNREHIGHSLEENQVKMTLRI